MSATRTFTMFAFARVKKRDALAERRVRHGKLSIESLRGGFLILHGAPSTGQLWMSPSSVSSLALRVKAIFWVACAAIYSDHKLKPPALF